MSDNFSIMVIEIKIAHIRMYNEIVRTLSNVRHVPNTMKNLIFFRYSL